MSVEWYLRLEDRESSELIGVVRIIDGGSPIVYAGRFDLADLTINLKNKWEVQSSSQRYAVIPILKTTADSLKEYLDNRIRMVSGDLLGLLNNRISLLTKEDLAVTAGAQPEREILHVSQMPVGFHHGARHKPRPNPASTGQVFAGGIST